jgi:hypothetical protein
MKTAIFAVCLVLAFSCGAQAKDLEEILTEAGRAIFNPTEYGFQLNALPWITANLDVREGLVVEYSFIGEEPRNVFTATANDAGNGVFEKVTQHQGKVKNLGELAYLAGNQFAETGDIFSVEITESWATYPAFKYEWDAKFNVDGQVSTSAGKAFVENIDLVKNVVALKYEEAVDFKENAPGCNIFYYVVGNPCPVAGTFNFAVTAEAEECRDPANNCAASISVVGNSLTLPINYVASYAAAVNNRQKLTHTFQLEANNENVFQIKLMSPDNNDITRVWIKSCALECNNLVHVLTVPNLKGLQLFALAFQVYGKRAFADAFEFATTLPESVVWFDKFAEQTILPGEYNLGLLVRASRIQIPILNDHFKNGISCMQNFPRAICDGYDSNLSWWENDQNTKIQGQTFKVIALKLADKIEQFIFFAIEEIGEQVKFVRDEVNKKTSNEYGNGLVFGELSGWVARQAQQTEEEAQYLEQALAA